MKNVTRHHTTLNSLERLPSSANGNPRFKCLFNGVSCQTGVDSSLGYKMQNFIGKNVIVTIGTHYGKATLNSIKEMVNNAE